MGNINQKWFIFNRLRIYVDSSLSRLSGCDTESLGKFLLPTG